MKKSMTANKAMRYGTRRLRAGDLFEASSRDARILSAIGKASYATRAMRAAPDPEPVEDIADVRAEYERVIGKRAYHGWDIPTLRQKMAEAKG